MSEATFFLLPSFPLFLAPLAAPCLAERTTLLNCPSNFCLFRLLRALFCSGR